jgi:ethanolamine kinase
MLEFSLPAHLQQVSHALDPANAEASALDTLSAYDSSWNDNKDNIKVKKFTGGWTNTLLKAKINIPGKSKAEIEADAILLRAYGVGTEAFIDRENEN